VSSFYWSNKPDGTTQDKTPPYHTDWTWDNMTNLSSGLVPSYQAAIVYQYTKDVQQADIKVVGAPAGQGVSNGDNTLADMNGAPYTGVTGGTQVVSVPQINGYLATVTDSNGKVVSLTNSQFTITYDAINNGSATNNSTRQDYTITYAPRSAKVLVNYTYGTGTNTNVSTSSSVDTVAYTAPDLPQSLEIITQTNGTYSLTVPAVSGYDWTVKDSKGKVLHK
jgi:large repetitive protein